MKHKRGLALFISGLLTFSFAGVACNDSTSSGTEASILFNGVALDEYTIIYDSEDVFSQYCAENLAELLLDVVACDLKVFPDGQTETQYEILVGATSREESQELTDVPLEEMQYIVSAKQDKIMLYANDYMVGGGANYLVNEILRPALVEGKTEVSYSENLTPFTYQFKAPENVVLMIGDGMGDNHIECAKYQGAIEEFYAARMPNIGKVTTYSASVTAGTAAYTDSAAAATALATGYKTLNGYIGIDELAKPKKNLRELAREKGANTAVLTTDAITGATPAGFIAHHTNRQDTGGLTKQINAELESGSLMIAKGDLGGGLCRRTRTTLNAISARDAKFFIMIEEGYIDKYSHSNSIPNMIDALARFNETVACVMQFTLMHPNTALLVTADHETGGLKQHEKGHFYYTGGDHTNADVSLFAMGLGTETLTQNGLCDNTDIPKFLAKAVYGVENFGDGKNEA